MPERCVEPSPVVGCDKSFAAARHVHVSRRRVHAEARAGASAERHVRDPRRRRGGFGRRYVSERVGNGAYGNHRKLSYAPRALVEDGDGGTRCLTARGQNYAQGKLTIPQIIEQDPRTEKWMAAADSTRIRKT